ncbi:CLUMA_CG007044, isoform C [Clunio marinus]|uniref:CLUMA_CG007044, isoform C n=1 Tax=Clunio marinus TaxID=568069 RepID=A0A1J1I1P4_9DIPT|nr:CLUMA_CG007044, isoform C [Clunio marinus]
MTLNHIQKPQKEHQTVQLTFSNGSITNIAVNISEELGKTSIWRQLTKDNKFDSNGQPFLDPGNKKESPPLNKKRLSIMSEEEEALTDDKRSSQNISKV